MSLRIALASSELLPDEVRHDAKKQHTEAESDEFAAAGHKQEDPTDEGNKAGDWVEPNAVGPTHIRGMFAEEDESDDLADELHEDAGGQQSGDDFVERKKAAADGEPTNHQQRDVRKVFGGMEPSENRKEISFARCGIRDA